MVIFTLKTLHKVFTRGVTNILFNFYINIVFITMNYKKSRRFIWPSKFRIPNMGSHADALLENLSETLYCLAFCMWRNLCPFPSTWWNFTSHRALHSVIYSEIRQNWSNSVGVFYVYILFKKFVGNIRVIKMLLQSCLVILHITQAAWPLLPSHPQKNPHPPTPLLKTPPYGRDRNG